MMINLSPSNEKLKSRVVRITSEILGCDEEEAIARLKSSEWNIRRAITDVSEG
jgi:N-acetylmuramic acid 6-phosphate (MurNAc-6-P) etherase